jgi:indole-3-acetate monooxygenase
MTASVDSVLRAVRELASEIAARAGEIEAARRVPKDLLDKLTAAGCFRLLLPKSHGGMGADLPGAMRVFEQLSRCDASVGWIAMLGASVWIDVAAMPRATFDAIYAKGPDVFLSGVISPMGAQVTKADGGYRVNGRWTFASGCQHAQWLYGNTVEDPETHAMRMVLFSKDQVEIEDTWKVSGLAGTGSHDFVAENVLVPAERSYQLFADQPVLDSTLVRIPAPVLFALAIGSAAIGIAQGALDDVIGLAGKKVRLLEQGPLAANPLFQHRVGTAEVSLRAARSLLYAEADDAWATATAAGEAVPEKRARARSAATFAATTAARVVDAAYTAAGGSAVYLSNPLQRRLRDVHALTQHFLVKLETLTASGAVLAGAEPQLMLF